MRLARSQGGVVHCLARRDAAKSSYEVTMCGEAFCTDEVVAGVLSMPWRPVYSGRADSVSCLACLSRAGRRAGR